MRRSLLLALVAAASGCSGVVDEAANHETCCAVELDAFRAAINADDTALRAASEALARRGPSAARYVETLYRAVPRERIGERELLLAALERCNDPGSVDFLTEVLTSPMPAPAAPVSSAQGEEAPELLAWDDERVAHGAAIEALRTLAAAGHRQAELALATSFPRTDRALWPTQLGALASVNPRWVKALVYARDPQLSRAASAVLYGELGAETAASTPAAPMPTQSSTEVITR